MIEFRNVSKSYGVGENAVKVLSGVSFSANAGEMSFIVGPSGSGKSTLLALAGAMLTPDSGTIRVADQEIGQMPSRKLAAFRNTEIGFVFQKFHLFEDFTAIDNVVLPAQIRRNFRHDVITRARGLLEKVGLKEYETSVVKKLSIGQKQRVSIARSLINAPSVVLADEPSASLDANSAKATLELLRQCATNACVVVVTHDSRLLEDAQIIWTIQGGILEKSVTETRKTTF